MPDTFDPTRSVEICPGLSWVGVTDDKTPFKCNPYVLDDGEEAVLFEPGSMLYYAGVRAKVLESVAAKKIRYILLSHQDPDLCASVPLWEAALGTNQFQIVTHSRTAVLLRHYGIQSKMYLVDQNDWVLPLRGGRVLKFVFAPWCHCPGTFMTYDDKTRTLFSGDVFGALTYDWKLYAGDHYTEAMRGFHEDYMASTPHLKSAMIQLDALRIDRIVPQHGSVIVRNVADHIRFLRGLRCGLTLMQPEIGPGRGESPKISKGGYRDLIALVLEREMGVVGKEQAIETAKGIVGLEVDERGNALAVKGDGKEILGRLLLKYHERFGSWAVLNCKMSLRAAAKEYGLELPKILGDKEGK